MSTFLWFFLIGGWVLAAIMLFVAWRFFRKAMIYDEIFQYIAGDIEINLKQFVRMSVSPMLQGDSEVQTAHRNMIVMGKRLEEIRLRMEAASGLNLRPPPIPPRPSYTDQ